MTKNIQQQLSDLKVENQQLQVIINGLELRGLVNQELLADRAKLRAALAGLVGVDGKEELERMETIMRLMPAPADDIVASLNAIRVLIETIYD